MAKILGLASRYPGLASGVCMAAFLCALGCFLLMTRTTSGRAEPSGEERATEFAADRAVPATAPVPFDADRAMGYLKDVCRIGPRISGSDGMKRQQELMQKHFEGLGGKLNYQRFKAKQNSRKQAVEMANLVVSWFPERQRRVLICSHYDTRPIADQEPDPRDWEKPFLSANDGGSGVALLMELAHAVKDLKTAVGVDFVFFDGEEYIFDRHNDRYFFGSQHFAQQYRRSRGQSVYLAGVLLDMVGGKNARFTKEPNSLVSAGPLVEQLWRIAAAQKCPAFVNEMGNVQVLDDHLALNRAGIPTADIIDFDSDPGKMYPHWHRLSDVPDNCSGDSLAQVARVLGVWLQIVK